MEASRVPQIMRRSPSPHLEEVGRPPENQFRTLRVDQGRRAHRTDSYRGNDSDNDEVEHLIPNSINQHRYCNPDVEEKIRRKLKFFFMNPCQKWQAKKKFPWKLVLQIVKILCVTVQLVVFGTSRSSHVSFIEKSEIAFRHLYLKDWEASYETLPYPPATGQYAIYTIPEFYEHVDYALMQYNKTQELAIGTYHFSELNDTEAPMQLHISKYKKGRIFAFNSTYEFNPQIVKEVIALYPVKKMVNGTEKEVYDTKLFLKQHKKKIYFDSIVHISLEFSLKTVHLRRLSKLNEPDCYLFNSKIEFDNSDHNGQMLIDLTVNEVPLDCNGHVEFGTAEQSLSVLNSVFDTVVILISFASMMLCIRSIFRAQLLKHEAERFFKHFMGKELSVYDKLEFLNMWYVMIIINDILTISGSIIKLQIENKDTYHYEVCGLLLGTGNLLVWFGVLRYLGFFRNYNILLVTLKRSAPNVLRFLVCAGVFYLGFCFCGWVVLGPYHIKFRFLSTTSECLFALVNGDELFVTFASLQSAPLFIWWFCRIYLYLFISLFIYVVLSVFISVIMDTYETIKHYYEHGFPKGELHEFIDQCTEEPHSPLFQSDDYYAGCDVLCCFKKKESHNSEPDETSPLLPS